MSTDRPLKRHLRIFLKHKDTFGPHGLNANDIHVQSLSTSDRIALWISARVGTMWFCYGLAVLMMSWALTQWLLGERAPDKYPFPFLFFVLGGIMQSLLMPLIMVAQNLQSRHAELRAETEYHINKANAEKLEQMDRKLSQLLGGLGLWSQQEQQD